MTKKKFYILDFMNDSLSLMTGRGIAFLNKTHDGEFFMSNYYYDGNRHNVFFGYEKKLPPNDNAEVRTVKVGVIFNDFDGSFNYDNQIIVD